MNEVESAVSCFAEGFSCSQAVFSAYAPQLGLDRQTALRIAGAFGGGMGGMGETCGAVTGAFMAIGLKYGKTRRGDEQAKEQTNSLVQQFVHQFKERNGSITCRDLLDSGNRTDNGAELGEGPCPGFVQDAAEILEQLLQ